MHSLLPARASSWLLFALLGSIFSCGTPDRPVLGRDDRRTSEDDDARDGEGEKPEDDFGEPDFEACATDTLTPGTGTRPVDIVWSIDSSGSMVDEIQKIRDHLDAFAAKLESSGIDDYHVVFMTEARWFNEMPNPLPTDPEHYLFVEEEVDSGQPLADLLTRFDAYRDFLRPNAATHVVSVTDDDSWSMPAEKFAKDMEAKLGHAFQLHAVASPAVDKDWLGLPTGRPAPPLPAGCEALYSRLDEQAVQEPLWSQCINWSLEGACVGDRGYADGVGYQHNRAADLTNGLKFSICDADWSPLFDALAKSVTESRSLPCQLRVPEPRKGEKLEPGLVNLTHRAQGATKPITVPRVASEDACDDHLGWHYDDSQEYMILCPKSCAQAERGGELQVSLGCKTVLL